MPVSFIGQPFTEYTVDDFAAITAVNLAGFFRLTQGIMADVDTRRSGHVVNVGASLVDHASSTQPAALTALTKGGLDAVTRCARHRIRRTRHSRRRGGPGNHQDPSPPNLSYEGLAELRPLGPVGEISDVVDRIFYLDQARFP